jgi:mannose-6-phosphate isomerase-like protein (cupin superfamily)
MNPEDENLPEDYGQAEIIDLEAIMAPHSEPWYNLTLSRVNDSLVRLGVFDGEFHWHKHDLEDELFFVISGKLLLDLPDETIELLPDQAYTVPRTILHRTRAEERTVVLMVESATVKARGDK